MDKMFRTFVIGAFGLLTLICVVSMGTISVYSQPAATPTRTVNPAHNKIAFSSQRDGHAQIYVMNRDGTNQVNVSNNLYNEKQPAWSPDGTQIAFASDRDGNTEICVMKADGSQQHCLTNESTSDKKPDEMLPDDRAPTWSSDGAEIAFVSTRSGHADIWVMAADGSNQVDLTNNASNSDQPAWSPNLRQIAFVSNRDGNPEICVMDASGSNQRCLTNNRTPDLKYNASRPQDSSPAWSPDSQKLAFVSTRSQKRNPQIYVMSADGSNPVNVTAQSSTDEQPAWSPDGNLIAFVSNRTGVMALFTMKPDGSNQTQLTFPTSAGDFEPTYGPLASPSNGPPTETLTPTLTALASVQSASTSVDQVPTHTPTPKPIVTVTTITPTHSITKTPTPHIIITRTPTPCLLRCLPPTKTPTPRL